MLLIGLGLLITGFHTEHVINMSTKLVCSRTYVAYISHFLGVAIQKILNQPNRFLTTWQSNGCSYCWLNLEPNPKYRWADIVAIYWPITGILVYCLICAGMRKNFFTGHNAEEDDRGYLQCLISQWRLLTFSVRMLFWIRLLLNCNILCLHYAYIINQNC